MNDNLLDLLVVGAGISGLGMAQMAKRRGIKARVLEAGTHLGGAIHSHRFETSSGQVWVELGAHTCYNSYGNLLQILEEAGQLETLQGKLKLRYRLQIGDKLLSIPSQLNFIELLGALPRMWLSRKAGRTAEGYFGRIIGRKNFAKVLGPALDAVVCQPAAAFPADALFRKKPRRKEILRSFTGPNGLQSFVEGVAAGLDVQYNSPAKILQRIPAGYQVLLGDGRSLKAKRLVLAVSPDVAAELLRESMPDLAARLDEIEMAEIESQAVLVHSEDLELPSLAGIIGVEDAFFSVVSRDPVPDPHHRAFTFHFRPGCLDQSDRLERICQVLGVGCSAIVESVVINNRLPALRLDHAERIDWIDQRLRGETLGLTGNWFQGVSIEDSLQRSAHESNRLLSQP
ncbi:MAG: FAD-dependent oxidoreductase [Chromatiales bacterium]